MAENRNFGSREEASYWPPIDETEEKNEPHYQTSNFFKTFAATSQVWGETPTIPVDILKQAEERVHAQRQFYKHLFIYLSVVTMVWLVGVALFISHQDKARYVGIFFPTFITLMGGLLLAYSFFKAFIWLRKSHRQRVMQEVQKMMS